MGEARRKTNQCAATIEKINSLDLPRISKAIQKLFSATSENYGRDCHLHAMFCQTLMRRHFGIEIDLVIGFAAWRVGEGDADMIMHASPTEDIKKFQVTNYEAFQSTNAIPYHAWLECGNWILDFTTYQFPSKAAALDAIDGQTTRVDWHPDFLWIDKKSLHPLHDVIQLRTGLCWYQRILPLEKTLTQHAREINEDDLTLFTMIYSNPDMVVVGPNQFR